MQMSLNIAIIGAVSAGKSTLLNALFADTYSDMKIKRTTMVPQVYVCGNNTSNAQEIRKLNSSKNNELLNKTDLDSTAISEMVHHVSELYDFVALPNNMVYTIYDIPGLNDAKTKQLYFNYIKENCHKFDIIIYVVDVNSAMNTSDEVDILKHVIECINRNRQNHDISTYMYILVNKCDDMSINECDKLVLLDEHQEMFEQVEKVVKDYIKPGIECKIMPVSVEDWYIYRICKKGNAMALETKYRNKLSIAFNGKKGEPITQDTFKTKKSVVRLTEFLTSAGFYNFWENLNNLIKDRHSTFFLNHIKYNIKSMTTIVNYASAGNLLELDHYHGRLRKCSISPEVVITAMIDYCKRFITLATTYFTSNGATKTSDTTNDIFRSTMIIYKLSKKYKFATDIHNTQLQLINHLEVNMKADISFTDFIEHCDKLQMLLADTNCDDSCNKLTEHLIYYVANNNEYIKKLDRQTDILDKFQKMISKYRLKITLIFIILSVLMRYYQTLTINSGIGYQIRNYWNNIAISYKDHDHFKEMLLYIKYYFNNAMLSSLDAFNSSYDFYLEETLMSEIKTSKYSNVVYTLL